MVYTQTKILKVCGLFFRNILETKIKQLNTFHTLINTVCSKSRYTLHISLKKFTAVSKGYSFKRTF